VLWITLCAAAVTTLVSVASTYDSPDVAGVHDDASRSVEIAEPLVNLAPGTSSVTSDLARGTATTALDAALAGRPPTVSITAANEYLSGGTSADLRAFLEARGGGLSPSATSGSIAAVEKQLAGYNEFVGPGQARVLRPGDLRVVSSAAQQGVPLLTRDQRLIRTMQALGLNVESF
jgi:hypothetical protein